MERRNYQARTIIKAIKIAHIIINEKTTVRATAKIMGCSKGSVHWCIKYPLQDVKPDLYEKVNEVLQVNYKERTQRGGQATKLRYERLKEEGVMNF